MNQEATNQTESGMKATEIISLLDSHEDRTTQDIAGLALQNGMDTAVAQGRADDWDLSNEIAVQSLPDVASYMGVDPNMIDEIIRQHEAGKRT